MYVLFMCIEKRFIDFKMTFPNKMKKLTYDIIYIIHEICRKYISTY